MDPARYHATQKAVHARARVHGVADGGGARDAGCARVSIRCLSQEREAASISSARGWRH
eukprot:COSAG02_NODE_8629_length_2499_cov_4.090000_2_plen_59_part_00